MRRHRAEPVWTIRDRPWPDRGAAGSRPRGPPGSPCPGSEESVAVPVRWSPPRRSWQDSGPGAWEPWEGRTQGADRLIRRTQFALQGLQLGPKSGTAFVRDVDQIVLDARLAPSRQSASNRRQTSSMRRARSMSRPSRLWLGRSLILFRSLVRGPWAAPRLKWPAAAKRRTRTSRKMSVLRAIVTSPSRFGSSWSGSPRLFIASLSPTALIDGHRAAARPTRGAPSHSRGFYSVR